MQEQTSLMLRSSFTSAELEYLRSHPDFMAKAEAVKADDLDAFETLIHDGVGMLLCRDYVPPIALDAFDPPSAHGNVSSIPNPPA